MSKIRIKDLVHVVPEDLTTSSAVPVATGRTPCGFIVVRHEDYTKAVQASELLGAAGVMVQVQVVGDDQNVTCIGCISQGGR